MASSSDLNAPCPDFADLLPAYALEALSEPERAQVEAHLHACAVCRAVLADYQAVAEGLLYTAPPAQAPAHLAADLQQRLRREARGRPAPRPAAPRPNWLSGLLAVLSRPAAALAAVLLVALLASNLYWVQTARALRAEQARLATAVEAQSSVVQALAGGGRAVRLLGATAAPQSSGTLILTADQNQAVLVVAGLPPQSTEQAYQLWLIHDGQRDSGGLFTVDASGHGTLLVQAPRAVESYDAVGITLEPAGGSPGPTSPPSLRGEL